MLDIRIAETADELEAVYRFRYHIYVEEMGRYRAIADHDQRRLADPEDDSSWIVYALDGTEIIGTLRMTWGGAGFSDRQITQYGLQPFLDELPPRRLGVGERTMISPARRGLDLFAALGAAIEPLLDAHDVRIVFGACEPHLLSLYCQYQRPYSNRNINSPEAGYLIPLVDIRQGPDTIADLRGTAGLPRCVQTVLDGTGTVRNASLCGAENYWADLRHALAVVTPKVFDGLTDDELQHCTDRSNIITCAAGDRILKKGGTARNIFVVLDGALQVTDDNNHHVAALRPGDLFGETAFLLHRTRTFNVDAITDDTRILGLSERHLHNVTNGQPELAAKLLGNISKILCRRLTSEEPDNS